MTYRILAPIAPIASITLISATRWPLPLPTARPIAVNRNPAARCALVGEPLSSALAREHNDANVIAMGARLTGEDMAKACLTAFLTTEFAGGRHSGRVDKLSHPQFEEQTA